jgi:bifunctional non-homologous end joining protein LigD
MKIGSHTVDISNEKKVFFPNEGITKGDLIAYYDRIADRLLPYLKGRPLTLRRFPDGINGTNFHQKEASDYFPDWIETIEVKKKEGGTVNQVICNNKAALIYLVNQGTISFHPWLSTSSSIHKPNKLVFDLDPPDGNFDLVIKGAKTLYNLLESEIKLHTFVMTTGSEGMHVVSPIKPKKDFDEVRSFAEAISEYLAKEHPDDFTTNMRKKNRNGRLFLDYLRNAYAQTSIAPFSIRALDKAPIATPLTRDELNKEGLDSKTYHLKNIFRRLSQKEKDWDHFRDQAKSIEEAVEKLEKLTDK